MAYSAPLSASMSAEESRSTTLALSFLHAHLSLVATVRAYGTVTPPLLSDDRAQPVGRLCAPNLYHYLYLAEDHLALVLASFRAPSPIIHPAIASALRASAESSCYAWWILESEDASTRLARMVADELARLSALSSPGYSGATSELRDLHPGEVVSRPGALEVFSMIEKDSAWLPAGSAQKFFRITSDLTRGGRSGVVEPFNQTSSLAGYAWRPNVNVLCDLICGAVLMHRVAFEKFMDYAGLSRGVRAVA